VTKEFFGKFRNNNAHKQESGVARNSTGTDTSPAISPLKLSKCSTDEARELVDYALASRLGVLPLGILKLSSHELLTLAAPNPDCPDLKTTLRFATGKEIKLIEVDAETIRQSLFPAYHADETHLITAQKTLIKKEKETPGASKTSLYRSARSEPAKFLNCLVDYAIARGASDIHLLPKKNGSFIRLRINGLLFDHDEPVCALETHKQLVSRIKVLSGLDITIRNSPQDGSLDVPIANSEDARLRVSCMPTVYGEKIVLRIMGLEGIRKLQDLDLDDVSSLFLREIMQKQEGSIIFAGPTGSGKSTTMRSVMSELVEKSLSLVSLEDPVEQQMPGVSQTSIGKSPDLDYASCLRSVLRQDPDVILLGEIRDEESARIAFQAALTGHLLLSTVHARDVFEVFLRLKNLGMDNFSIARSLNLIVCQRLIPRLCEECKVVDLESSNKLGHKIYRETGCTSCDYSGFSGRVLLVEALKLTKTLSREICRAEDHDIYEFLKPFLNESNYVSLRKMAQKQLFNGKLSLKHLSSILGKEE